MKALLALAILTTSSVALAQPMVRDHREPIAGSAIVSGSVTIHPVDQRSTLTYAPTTSYDHDHYDDSYDRYDDRPRFRRGIVLASNATFVHDHHDHSVKPMYIALDRARDFTRLRLTRDNGRAFIDRVVVMYPNGRSRTITVNQTLSAELPSLMIDLDHRAVTGVYIYGTSWRGRASFDVIGLRR
jgi:hypothetical protein